MTAVLLPAEPSPLGPSRFAARALRPVGTVGDEIEHARLALADALSLLGQVPSAMYCPHDPTEALRALTTAEAAIRHDLRSGSAEAFRRPHLATALVRLRQARLAVYEAQAGARTLTNRRLSALLEHLRHVASIPDLIDAVPRALSELGYDRVMLSQLNQGRWIPLSSYVRDDPDQAMQMNAIARGVARPVDPRLIEYDMVDRKRPILVLDARGNGRVHPELLALTEVRSYAGAPIVVDSGVAGFIHADSTSSGRTVAEPDGLLLAAVGEVVAFALERTVLRRRLQRIADLVGETDEELVIRIEQARGSDAGHESWPGPIDGVTAEASSRRMERLSPRESQVLRLLAEGANNSAIAIRMGVAETTVKTHVKHVIRKLGVANRAEAVAVYLRLTYRHRPGDQRR